MCIKDGKLLLKKNPQKHVLHLKALYKTRLGTIYRSSIFFPYKDCIQVIMNSVIIKFCHSLLFQKKRNINQTDSFKHKTMQRFK